MGIERIGNQGSKMRVNEVKLCGQNHDNYPPRTRKSERPAGDCSLNLALEGQLSLLLLGSANMLRPAARVFSSVLAVGGAAADQLAGMYVLLDELMSVVRQQSCRTVTASR